MTARSKNRLIVLIILVCSVSAVFLDFPKYYQSFHGWLNKNLRVTLPNLPNVPYKLGLDLQGGTHLIYEADVAQIPSEDRSSAIEGARDVIDRRVNAFGVAEPNIQSSRAGDSWRIIVELAGVNDVSEAIKMIGETPLLEFKTQAAAPTTTSQLTAEEQNQLDDFNKEAKTKADGLLTQALKGEDFNKLIAENSEDTGSKEQNGELGFVKKGVLVPEFENACFDSTKKGEIYKELVQSAFGYHIIKKIDERGDVNPDGTDSREANCQHLLIRTKSIYDIKPELLKPEWDYTGLTGKQLKRSQVTFDPQTNAAQVSLEFNDEGAKLFADITKNNVGKLVAIFLDGQPISTPQVIEAITSGRAVISGTFSLAEAKLLAQRLNAGALPVPISLIYQQTVGASLGNISLQKSLTAALYGLLGVAIFMVLFYRLPGLLAVLALLIYGLINLALFKFIPVTLSLAGIAGFILSVGMAVDANILIFERLREEIANKNPLKNAIDEGFKRAWPSIRDGNYTTIITSLILMWFSTSMVKGFAITLIFGIFVSMFTALTITSAFMKFIADTKLQKYPWLWATPKKNIYDKNS